MPQKAIRFFSQDVSYSIKKRTDIRIWLEKAINKENNNITELTYIFCNDSYLLELNKKFLDHDTLTDVITFDLSEESDSIIGEIYISIERIKANASEYKVKMQEELHRVMVHGLLHLCGYNDVSREEKDIMRKKEDYYLSLRQNMQFT